MKFATKDTASDAALPASRTLWAAPTLQRLMKPSWGLADQALISLASFITFLILARELSINAFGQFVLVNTGLQIILSFQGPLITQPHNVLSFRHGLADYRTYSSTSLYTQGALVLVTLVVFAAAGAVISIWSESMSQLVWLMTGAAVAWQAQEFFRRVMYTEERPLHAFLNDLVSYGGQVVFVLALLALNILSASTTIISIAVTSTIAAIWGFFQTRDSFNGRFNREFVKTNWQHSRWLVGASATALINRNLWYYMLALFSGPAATATLAAVTILLRPIGVLVTAIETMLPTHLARRLAVNSKLPGFSAHRPALLLAPLVLGYCLFILLAGKATMELLYGDTYGQPSLLILLMALFYALAYCQSILDSTMRALDSTRILFVASAVVAVLTVSVGALLTGFLSEEGAVLGMIINSVVIVYLVARRVREAMA